jgi:hypothetical protein
MRNATNESLNIRENNAECTALIDNQTAYVAKPKCHNGGEIEQLQD